MRQRLIRFCLSLSLTVGACTTVWPTTTNAVILVDLDGDGYLDAFAANCCGSGSSNGTQIVPHPPSNAVWLNDPQHPGSLKISQRQFTAGTSDVALGDVDGDGDLDAVTANLTISQPPIAGPQTGNIWLNDGTGHFQNTGQQLGAPTNQSVALGDLDHDGDLDVLMGDNDGPASVWLNNGSGHFTDTGQTLGKTQTRHVLLGDMDGDGDVDALLNRRTRSANYGEIWLNNGSGYFVASNQRLNARTDCAFGLGDVDADGDLDVFVGCPTHAQVWLTDGMGKFTLQP